MKQEKDYLDLNPLYARPGEATSVPKYTIPKESMLPETAYQIVHDLSMLDGNARLNLATFVSTWMEPMATKVYEEAFDKNAIDKDEYPMTAAMETYCWRMLADLWNAPNPENTIGCSTTGSSEACMLGALALKRRWQERRKAEGKPIDKPNLIMSSTVQVCWDKFCNYFDVEARHIPISMEHKELDGADLEKYVDENTIGLVAILGVTYTGAYDPVEKLSAVLDEIEKKTGINVPIHVDGASGAMLAPFLNPDLVWDFRLPRVASINTSGHKYGLVYPGLGWVVWRETAVLPESLIFRVSYLGGDMPTFALNFSRPGGQILLQYYNFLRLGFEGYKAVQGAAMNVAQYLADNVTEAGPFELWDANPKMPLVCWSLKSEGAENRNWDLYDLSERLRMNGWQVPAYPMPEDLTDVAVMRVVVRNGMSEDLIANLLEDIKVHVKHLDSLGVPGATKKAATGFHH